MAASARVNTYFREKVDLITTKTNDVYKRVFKAEIKEDETAKQKDFEDVVDVIFKEVWPPLTEVKSFMERYKSAKEMRFFVCNTRRGKRADKMLCSLAQLTEIGTSGTTSFFMFKLVNALKTISEALCLFKEVNFTQQLQKIADDQDTVT